MWHVCSLPSVVNVIVYLYHHYRDLTIGEWLDHHHMALTIEEGLYHHHTALTIDGLWC